MGHQHVMSNFAQRLNALYHLLTAGMFDKALVNSENLRDNCGSRTCWILKEHALIISTVLAALLGTAFGFAIRQAYPSETALTWIGVISSLNRFFFRSFQIKYFART